MGYNTIGCCLKGLPKSCKRDEVAKRDEETQSIFWITDRWTAKTLPSEEPRGDDLGKS